jgi:hypothetical protein
MERCPKCGNKLSNIDVLCPRCGALVEVIQVRNSHIPPSAAQENTPPPSTERPNLIIYNEDFPGDEPVPGDADVETASPDISRPEDILPLQPPAVQLAQPFVPARLYETPEDLAREVQAETRMARRARQKKWSDIEEPQPASPFSEEPESRSSRSAGRHAAPSSPEDQPLGQADQLTSCASWRSRVAGSSVESESPIVPEEPAAAPVIADDADVNSPALETPVRRYRAEYRESQNSGKTKTRKPQPDTKKSKEQRRLPVPAAILLWVMIAAVLFLGFYYLNQHVKSAYGSYGAFLSALTNGKLSLDATGDINAINVKVSETKTAQGAPSHTFSVTAAGATSVRFFPTGDVFEMKDGMVTFEVPDESIALARGVLTYDNSIQAEGVSLDLTVGSSTVSYPVDPFELHLISSDYKREEPQQAQSVASSDSVLISLVVSPTAAVYINNDNYSDKLSDDGRLSIEYPLSDTGETIFAVDVMQPGRQAIKDSFTVTSQASQTLLTPEAAYLRTYTDSFECRGTTDPGATLSALLNNKTFAGLVSDSGSYSAACTATEYGLYSVTLTASVTGKANTVTDIAVERLPDPEVFKPNAKKMSAADILKNISVLFNVGVRLDSKIGVVTSDGLAQKFSVEAGSKQLSCYYYGQTPQLSAGQNYTLYGMVDETGGFYVMFVG